MTQWLQSIGFLFSWSRKPDPMQGDTGIGDFILKLDGSVHTVAPEGGFKW